MTRLKLLTSAVAFAAFGHSATAQTSQKWSIQGSGIYALLSGDAFEVFKSGAGGELQLRYTPGAWSFGAGAQMTKHKPKDEAVDALITDIALIGAFFEPRRVIDVGSTSWAPYISGRFAFSSMSFSERDLSGVGFDLDAEPASGATANVGGGALIRLSSRANLDLGATVGYTKFKNSRMTLRDADTGAIVVGDDGTPLDFTVKFGSGFNAVIRVGFAIGLGG